MRRKIVPLSFLAATLLSAALVISVASCNRRNGDSELDNAPPPVPVPDALEQRVKLALEAAHNRPVDIQHNFWTVFHAVLGMGFDTELVDSKRNKKVKAIDVICQDGDRIAGLKFIPTQYGLDVETQAGSGVGQGHQDQFVAEMAQWGLPPETKVKVAGKEYQFKDFHRNSMMRASTSTTTGPPDPNGHQELSWAIIIIGQYYGTDYKWTNSKGEKLTFEDIVRYEWKEPVDETAACGGTHRLFGLTWAYHLHRKRGGKKEGVWKDVADKIEEYKHKAQQYQNRDEGDDRGFFSTKYLSGPGPGKDLGTCGHVLEWLALAMTDKELKNGWVEDAANALSMMIIRGQKEAMEGGALYHAVHGLHLYYNRRWGKLGSDPVIPLPPKD